MKIGVIGAGTMGQGIAKAFAQVGGNTVVLCDIKQEWADNGKAKIVKGYDRLVAKGKMTKAKADEALRIGLVNAVYPQAELMDNALKLANKIAKNAPIAVRNCKKAMNEGISLPIDKAVEVEEKLFGDCFETHDQQEGMACFLSKEKPKPKAVFTNN